MTNPRHWFGIGVIIVVWLLIALFLSSGQPYGSPDEAANAFFIHQQATTGKMLAVSPLSPSQLNFAHPRSVVVHGSQLLPASFLGLIQVGAWFERFFGRDAAAWLVPLLSAFGLAALYGILRRFWTVGWSLTGVVLLALNPVWVQFQTLPMFHNGAFVSLLLVAGYCLRRQFERPSWTWAAAVGLAYGAAIYFRPIEVLWTGPLLAIVLLTMPGRWKWFTITLVCAAVVQLPWLLADRALYGSYLSTGYTPEGLTSDQVGASSVITSLWKIITPAGGRWSLHFLSSAWWYLILIFPASSALALASIGTYLKRKFVVWSKIVKLSLVSIFIIFPLAYYGSWDLYPLLASSRVGTLSSYDRYWLVLFVAMVPAIVLTLKRISTVRPWLGWATAVFLIASYIITIVWNPGSGLVVRYHRRNQAQQLVASVLAATNPSSMVIAGGDDKYFLGQRLTANMMPTTPDEWKDVVTMSAQRPVFVLQSTSGFSASGAREALAPFGLALTRVQDLPGDTLWRITVRTQ